MMTIDKFVVKIINNRARIIDRENASSTIINFGNNVHPETRKELANKLLPIIDKMVADKEVELKYLEVTEYEDDYE